MKKLVALLGVSVLLAGCDLMGGTTEESQESESSESSIESSVESSESSVEESSESSTESSSSASESSGGEVSTSEFPLVPQKSEIDQGYTLESDPLLQEIQTRMDQTEELGIENDVAIHFTGLFLGEQGQDNVQAVFIMVNRTDMAMTNINLTVSMSTVDGEVILDSAPFVLSEDEFGILEPDTTMPAYFRIPMDSQEAFFSVSNLENVTYSIDSFEYDER
ncbi:hypothetical protein JTF06_03475 [Desemzia sp. RIT804]|uniref:hypothetical protein n=1 Tax=Desemzia sp. RIT 804 TaxID=2810209 RepID=UPI0019519CDC|nr:hypothetical protein [Desemzia sp. RIT 804]MBM6613957.1 hypothetical protein [Desemzia sp. RIT 804]